MSSRTSLTLVICTYRRPRDVATLVRSLQEQVRRPDEVLVVDGSPDDETERALTEASLLDDETVQYFRVTEEHRGLTRQRNWGITRSSGEIVAFLDDDIVPEPEYFQEVEGCFRRHPGAVGVGGYIANAVQWRQVPDGARTGSLSVFRLGQWERREDLRWRVRRLLGLSGTRPPGRMPPSGHGRPVTFYPPTGEDHEVDYILGGAAAWRRKVLEEERFSSFFEGYGLYEDLEYCIRASAHGSLVLCTAARLAHHHAPGGRPDWVRYGRMVVRNGWYVWRSRWRRPSLADRMRWWATTGVLTACLVGDALRLHRPMDSLAQACGRLLGAVGVLLAPPSLPERSDA